MWLGDDLLAFVQLGGFWDAPNIDSLGYEVPVLHVLKVKSDVLAAPVGFCKEKLLVDLCHEASCSLTKVFSAAVVSPHQMQRNKLFCGR